MLKEKKKIWEGKYFNKWGGGPKQNKPNSHSLPNQNHVNYQFHIISISIIIIHEILLQWREEGK